MRKYLILVGLMLAGMPLITSCVDNEESASVTKVRDAKAEELLSKAILNKAQAQAAEAQAILTKAMAAKTEAETELVRINAELAKVQLESARVELEAQKAKLEAIKAQAELDIKRAAMQLQEIAQQMEKSKLQNEIDMAKKMQELLDAVAANNDANRTKLASLLNSIQTSESNIIDWQAQIYTYESYIVQLEAEIADPMSLIAETVEYYKAKIAEEEDNIAAAKELLDKDSKELNAELAALNEDYVKVAKEYWALNDEVTENNKAITEIEGSEEYTTFKPLTFVKNVAGVAYGYDYNFYISSIVDEKAGTYTYEYYAEKDGEEDKIVFATDFTYSSKTGKIVAGGTFDKEAANAFKTALNDESAKILADYQAEKVADQVVTYSEGKDWPTYHYNDYESKTRQEHLDYYSDLLKRAKVDEKRAAVESKEAEAKAAQTKIDEAKAAEQKAWYDWQNSSDPTSTSQEEYDLRAAAKAHNDYVEGEEYQTAREAYQGNVYARYKYSAETLYSFKANALVNIEGYNKSLKEYNETLEKIEKNLVTANKALADAKKTRDDKEADMISKHAKYDDARLAYAKESSESNKTAMESAESVWNLAKTEYDNAESEVSAKQIAVNNLNSEKEVVEGNIETANGQIEYLNGEIAKIEAAPALTAAWNAASAKEQELNEAYNAAWKIYDETPIEEQTYSPLVVAYNEALQASADAETAFNEINAEISDIKSVIENFGYVEFLVEKYTTALKIASDDKDNRDKAVETAFADVDKLAAAAEAQCKAVEDVVALQTKNAELDESKAELWKEMTQIKAKKDEIKAFLVGYTLDDAVVDPQTGAVIVPATDVEGVEAIEARIANSEANIKYYNEMIDFWIETATEYVGENPACIETYKREIEVLKAKIAAEEAILANLKAEYDATLAAIK